MGTYTDWFIASADEAKALGHADDPFHGPWPHLQVKGILVSDVEALGEILSDSEEEDFALEVAYESPEAVAANRAMATMSDEELVAASELDLGGVVVMLVPDPFVDALASLDERHWPAVATGWAALVEVVDAPELLESLAEMVQFARTAKQSGRSILQLLVGG